LWTPLVALTSHRGKTMTTLDELIEAARKVKMTPEQEAAQRRSFAYGNCKLENDRITREMIAEADKRLFGEQKPETREG
jgi:hypothetical protein